MSSPQPKLHSALTADEAREAIILDFTNQLRAKLIAAGLEGQHTTFVNAEWVGGVRVKAFLRKAVDVKAVGSLGEAGESDEQIEASASVQREVKNPEVVREELRTATEIPLADLDAVPWPAQAADSVLSKATEARSFERLTELHEAARAEGPEPYVENAGGAAAPYEPPNFVTEEVPFILSRKDTEQGNELPVLNPENSIVAPLCQFCSKPVSDNPNGLRSHMRTHVKEGVAIEFTNGDGARAWRAV